MRRLALLASASPWMGTLFHAAAGNLGRFHLRPGRSKAQEPACEGAEDQVEAQRLPKMAARHAGGHQRIRQQQGGGPASQKERRGQGRFPPGGAEHANERIQTREVEESAECGKEINPAGAGPVVLQCSPKGWEFRTVVEALKFWIFPSDIVAEEHVEEDERRDQESEPGQQ